MSRVVPSVACLALLLVSACLSFAADNPAQSAIKSSLIVVVGAPGNDTYAPLFAEQLQTWRKLAESAALDFTAIGASEGDKADKEHLQSVLAEQTKRETSSPLWLVLIGHGTFDGRTASFNLRGPDVTSTELAEWLDSAARPLVLIDTSAASGPFLTALSRPERVVVTATKSGQERNFARFGKFLAARIADPQADLDKDEQTSLFEAFLAAARDTTTFYTEAGRVVTEHPLLDDNGDGRGVRGDFFERGRLKQPLGGNQAADGDRARSIFLKPSDRERSLTPEQLARREELEAVLASLRGEKADLKSDEYFARLEPLLVELARMSLAEGVK